MTDLSAVRKIPGRRRCLRVPAVDRTLRVLEDRAAPAGASSLPRCCAARSGRKAAARGDARMRSLSVRLRRKRRWIRSLSLMPLLLSLSLFGVSAPSGPRGRYACWSHHQTSTPSSSLQVLRGSDAAYLFMNAPPAGRVAHLASSPVGPGLSALTAYFFSAEITPVGPGLCRPQPGPRCLLRFVPAAQDSEVVHGMVAPPPPGLGCAPPATLRLRRM